jgi:hypothetical protein
MRRHDVVIDYDFEHPRFSGVMTEVRLDSELLWRTWWPSRLAEGMADDYPAKWTATLLESWVRG